MSDAAERQVKFHSVAHADAVDVGVCSVHLSCSAVVVAAVVADTCVTFALWIALAAVAVG